MGDVQTPATGVAQGRRERTTAALLVFVVLASVYAMTARWTSPPYGDDALTNVFSGWTLATTGTPWIADQPVELDDGRLLFVGWIVEGTGGLTSQYPPGAALTVAPAYWLADLVADVDTRPVTLTDPTAPEFGAVTYQEPPVWPATLSAVLVTAAFGAVVTMTASALGEDRRTAIVVGLAAGLATSAWAVASAKSWLHGPTMLAISLALLAAARSRWLAAGLAFGFGILCRPHVAIVAAVVGLWVGVARREWRPVAEVGIGSGMGLAALLAYNRAVHGEWSVIGGYSADFAENAASSDLLGFAANVGLGLLHPRYGLLLWAPFLVVLGFAAWRYRGTLPDWSWAATVGGVAYLLLQWKANRASGGEGFFPYRYPIAMLAASMPLLGSVGARWWRDHDGPGRRVLAYTLVFATLGQLTGAVAF